ncbi:MAG: hypothetical protein ACYC9O_08515, partial [Candidatus Latescibacterota bacterium]
GIGMVQGRDTTVTKIERWLKRAEAFGKERAYTLFVHPAVFEFLIENEEERLRMLRSSTSMDVDLVVDAKLAIEEFHCFSTARAKDVTEEFLPGAKHHGESDREKKPRGKSGPGGEREEQPSRAPEPLKAYSRPAEEDKFGRKPKP